MARFLASSLTKQSHFIRPPHHYTNAQTCPHSYGDESITGNKSSDDEKNMLKQGLEASQRMFASSDDVKDIYDIYSDDAKLPAATGAPATAQPSSNSSYDDLSARLSKLTQSKEEDKKDDIAARLNALKVRRWIVTRKKYNFTATCDERSEEH